MKKDSSARYEPLTEAIDLLPEENQLNAYRFVTRYWLKWEEPDQSIDSTAYAVFLIAKVILDENKKRRENGCKGWRPKKVRNKNTKQT